MISPLAARSDTHQINLLNTDQHTSKRSNVAEEKIQRPQLALQRELSRDHKMRVPTKLDWGMNNYLILDVNLHARE